MTTISTFILSIHDANTLFPCVNIFTYVKIISRNVKTLSSFDYEVQNINHNTLIHNIHPSLPLIILSLPFRIFNILLLLVTLSKVIEKTFFSELHLFKDSKISLAIPPWRLYQCDIPQTLRMRYP